MKKVICLFAFLFLVILLPQKVYSQEASIDLVVFEPLPEADFAAFALANIPSGNTRIFAINITPSGMRVILDGQIQWKKDNSSNFETLYSFQTHPFLSRNITNMDLGRTDIRIKNNETNSNLAEENLRRGKPSGLYKISLILRDALGRRLDDDTEVLSFVNPSQTLTIRAPEANSTQDIGSVILQWDTVVGAESYEVKANVRRNESQSLEEALTQGTPIINNEDVGRVNVANLRRYFTREPLPGQEIVVQVAAVIPGPGGGERLFSNIINFYIGSSSSPENEAFKARLLTILSSFSGSSMQNFLDMIRNEEIDISSIRIVDETGQIITLAELQQVLNYLQTNPDALLNAQFTSR